MIFRIDLKIILFLVLFFYTKQIKNYFFIMIFAIIHELFHIIVGMLFKFKINKITIFPMGLSAQFFEVEHYKQNKNVEIKKIITYLAGPTSNILIAIILSMINLENNIKYPIIYSNILISIFNLIPIYPLDGGRIISSILNIYYGKEKSKIITDIISSISIFIITFIFSILIYYFKNIGFLFVLIYLWGIMINSSNSY